MFDKKPGIAHFVKKSLHQNHKADQKLKDGSLNAV